MAVIKMTVAEYAERRGIVPGAVRRAIKFGYATPGVVKREKFGKVHVLHVDEKILKKYLEVT